MAYYKELQRKELRKNIIFTIFILLFATLSTYYIYNKFVDERDEILQSASLEVIFHEKDGSHFFLNRSSLVSDNVGLSSKPYRFTIKNNSKKLVKYKIMLDKDLARTNSSTYNEEIPKSIIKVAIHEKNKANSIYNLDDLENNNLVVTELDAGKEIEYTLRFWTSIDNTWHFNDDVTYAYYGLIKVVEY